MAGDNDPLLEAVKAWAEREKRHNPTFSLVVGNKMFTIDQIVEHMEKDTEEGRMLRKMILETATALFFNYRPSKKG